MSKYDSFDATVNYLYCSHLCKVLFLPFILFFFIRLHSLFLPEYPCLHQIVNMASLTYLCSCCFHSDLNVIDKGLFKNEGSLKQFFYKKKPKKLVIKYFSFLPLKLFKCLLNQHRWNYYLLKRFFSQ